MRSSTEHVQLDKRSSWGWAPGSSGIEKSLEPVKKPQGVAKGSGCKRGCVSRIRKCPCSVLWRTQHSDAWSWPWLWQHQSFVTLMWAGQWKEVRGSLIAVDWGGNKSRGKIEFLELSQRSLFKGRRRISAESWWWYKGLLVGLRDQPCTEESVILDKERKKLVGSFEGTGRIGPQAHMADWPSLEWQTNW